MSRHLLALALVSAIGCRKDLAHEDLDGDGVSAADGDCVPGDPAISPDAAEVCDGRDNNCDGDIDEDVGIAWYTDEDGDGFGGDEVIACTPPAGAVAHGGDCDDASPQVNPGAREVCQDTVDYDCDGLPGGSDGDGDGTVACEDCDDGDATAFPGAPETCDDADDDCDGEVDEGATDADTFYVDLDGDGAGSDRVTVTDCAAPAGFVTAADDCDDLHAESHPGASERCDALDNDCDGTIDDGASGTTTWYADTDGDGFGDATATQDACGRPAGHVDNDDDCDDADATKNPEATESCADPEDLNCDGSVGQADGDGDGTPACDDCDDQDASVEPGAPETCDGKDNDCNGEADETAPVWYADIDGDGHGGARITAVSCTAPGGFVASSDDCDDLSATAYPGATEVCNGKDDDCAGGVPANEADGDGDRWRGCEGDCADSDASAYPGALELCDGQDDDCDGKADDLAIDVGTYYVDGDGDGVGGDTAVNACKQPDDTSTLTGDCDDGDAFVSPLGDELCKTVGVDDDCDGSADIGAIDGSPFYRDVDGDGYGVATQFLLACKAPAGYAASSDDCNDKDDKTYPGATDLPNDAVDKNCDGDLFGSGLDPTNPTLSCRHAKIVNPSATNGLYWLGGGSVPAFQAYCDMVVAGGTGWTRVAYYTTSDSTSLRTDNAVGTQGSSSNHKLSSAQVNSVVGTAPYASLAHRIASNEYYRWDGTTRVFNWSTLDATDSWTNSACSNGAALYRATDGQSFAPWNSGPAWARISVCPTGFNKGGYFHFSDNAYRIRLFIKNETEAAGYDFNDLRNSTSAWYVQPAVVIGTTSSPAGVSCNAIKAAGNSFGDGQYVIQPSGQPATTVWCDMTSDPLAGWTLVTKYMNGGAGNGASLLAGADNATDLVTPAVNGKAKFADAFINAIPWTSYKIENVGDAARAMRTDTKFTVAWDAAQGANNGTINGHQLQWCYLAVPAFGTQCMTMSNTNTFGVAPHEAGLGGHWIHTPSSATLGGFSCGFQASAETNCSRISDYFVVRHWVK